MKNQSTNISLRSIGIMLVFIVIVPFLPLLISRQWDWWEAWVYAIIGILGFAVSRILAARRNPDLLAEERDIPLSFNRLNCSLVSRRRRMSNCLSSIQMSLSGKDVNLSVSAFYYLWLN